MRPCCKPVIDVEGLLLGSGERIAGHERRGELRDGARGVHGHLIGEHNHGRAIVNQHFVVRNEAGDLA